jgi:hypothetical protein
LQLSLSPSSSASLRGTFASVLVARLGVNVGINDRI